MTFLLCFSIYFYQFIYSSNLFFAGVGGSQLWRTDGTLEGTVRALEKNGNDIYIDRKGTNSRHPASFGVYGNSVYLSGNIVYDNVPIGGYAVQNSEELVKGFNQAVAVYDSDTPSGGMISVQLSVNQGVIALGNIASSSNSNSGKKKLLFLLSLPVSYATAQSLIFNSLIALGHTVDTVYSDTETFQAIETNKNNVLLNLTHSTQSTYNTQNPNTPHRPQTDGHAPYKLYDCLLLSLAFPGDMGGLQITRTIRLSESLVLNSTALPIYIFSQVNYFYDISFIYFFNCFIFFNCFVLLLICSVILSLLLVLFFFSRYFFFLSFLDFFLLFSPFLFLFFSFFRLTTSVYRI